MPLKIDERLCTVCGSCVKECPNDSLQITEGRLVIAHPADCTNCGTCELSCPEGAITIEIESL